MNGMIRHGRRINGARRGELGGCCMGDAFRRWVYRSLGLDIFELVLNCEELPLVDHGNSNVCMNFERPAAIECLH